MSRTAITLKLKMCPLLAEACSCAEKLLTDINLPSLMPDEDNNFGGSLVSDFRKWWRHVQPKNLKRLWTENCFSSVLKFASKNTRNLGLKLTILQAFKFVPFYPQKWYLNRAAKIPRDINFWRHFGATIVLAIWRTRKKCLSRYYSPTQPKLRSRKRAVPVLRA